jgi:DNA-binding CsgD family transcriptional regulator
MHIVKGQKTRKQLICLNLFWDGHLIKLIWKKEIINENKNKKQKMWIIQKIALNIKRNNKWKHGIV